MREPRVNAPEVFVAGGILQPQPGELRDFLRDDLIIQRFR
jgi:hypothetical protein